MEQKIIVSIIFFLLGVLFFFNNKNIGKGASKFYQWFYTEERLIIMFRIVGIILFIGGILMLVLK